jgi:hypothetical protein
VSTKYVWRAERLRDSRVATIVRRELARRTDLGRITQDLRGLKSRRVFGVSANSALRRLESILPELPRLIVQQAAERRTKKLAHLFSGDAQSDPSRLHYHKTLEELRELVRDPDFQKLAKDPEALRFLERNVLSTLLDQTAGTVDSYDKLNLETGTFNALVKQLYPKDFPSLRVDAHHIIEDRTYERFRDTWKLLGWESAEDMPAIPLMYEYHIRSPKRLPRIEELGKKKDIKSLSKELESAIKLDKFTSPEELIDAYMRFYQKEAIWKDVRPVLEAVQYEISVRRSRARLVRELKKAK